MRSRISLFILIGLFLFIIDYRFSYDEDLNQIIIPDDEILGLIDTWRDQVGRDPSDEEISLVEKYNEKFDNIFHIRVEGVDPLGISWNRCIENASGDYLCIWSVDDLRTPDSIEVMAKALDENTDVDFVYGNYHIVPSYGLKQGQLVDESDKSDLLKVGMILGPFFMFRKSFLKMTGVFDEQFSCCNDYDLAMRFARCGKGMHLSLIHI